MVHVCKVVVQALWEHHEKDLDFLTRENEEMRENMDKNAMATANIIPQLGM